MSKHHAVMVIGGGPVGSSATRTLASQGVDVALIDKAVFPQIFGEAAWAQAYEYEADGIRLFHRDRCLSDVGGHRALYFPARHHTQASVGHGHIALLLGAMVYGGITDESTLAGLSLQPRVAR